MPLRHFETQQLIDWGMAYPEECQHVVRTEETGMDSYESTMDVVFRAPDDGKFWLFEYQYNNGSGWNSISGISDDPYKPEWPTVTAHEVEPYEVKTTKYRVIKGEP